MREIFVRFALVGLGFGGAGTSEAAAQDISSAAGDYVCISEAVIGIQYKETKKDARPSSPYYAGIISKDRVGGTQFFLRIRRNEAAQSCEDNPADWEFCNRKFKMYATDFQIVPEVAFGDSSDNFYSASGSFHLLTGGRFSAFRFFDDSHDSYLAHGRCEQMSSAQTNRNPSQ